jgi:hypothetical protein
MINKLIFTMVALLVVGEFAAADEIDAVINDSSRFFTKGLKSPENLNYGWLKLDSEGKVVSTIYRAGIVNKATKVAMGTFDEKKKKWLPGAAIEGGIEADIFKDRGTEMQLRMIRANDKKTITQILVKNTDGKLVKADPEFDAILKQIGGQNNGTGAVAYLRLELDAKGDVLKTFGVMNGVVNKDTKVVMGKFNETAKKWEAGDAIPNGLYGDIFKDLGAKTMYVRITLRDDRRGITQILVRQIGEKGKK